MMMMTRGTDATLCDPSTNSNNGISHFTRGASNSDGMCCQQSNVRGNGDLHMQEIMDLMKTRACSSDDMPSQGVWNCDGGGDASRRFSRECGSPDMGRLLCSSLQGHSRIPTLMGSLTMRGGGSLGHQGREGNFGSEG